METKQQKVKCGNCGEIVIKCNKCKRLLSSIIEDADEFPTIYCMDNQYEYDIKTEHMRFAGKPNSHFCDTCITETDLDDEVD